MRFLVDRCAGRRLSRWLRDQGHDVVDSRDLGPDPGDRTLLSWANDDARVLVTMDKDFGELVFARRASHEGIVRLPEVPAAERIELMDAVLRRHRDELEARAVVTVRGGRIRVSRTAES